MKDAMNGRVPKAIRQREPQSVKSGAGNQGNMAREHSCSIP